MLIWATLDSRGLVFDSRVGYILLEGVDSIDRVSLSLVALPRVPNDIAVVVDKPPPELPGFVPVNLKFPWHDFLPCHGLRSV
jgi:hypothetical protein